MATFVLVHGAFYGGWCWQKVKRPLEAAGHTVYTPTLTGSGERSHLLNKSIGLATHIQDIVNVLTYEDLHDVILVGHSYGGMVITGAADRALERIKKLVYLDAHIPENGKSALDVLSGGTSAALDEINEAPPADEANDQWLLTSLPPEATGIVSAEDLAFIGNKKGPHPLATLAEKIHLQHNVPYVLPHSYIRCTDRSGFAPIFPVDPLAPFYQKIEAEGWPTYEIPSGHDPMITHKEKLVAILLMLGD